LRLPTRRRGSYRELNGSSSRTGRARTGALPPSQPESADVLLVETEVVTDLVTDGLHDMGAEAPAIVAEVAHERDESLSCTKAAPVWSRRLSRGRRVGSGYCAPR